MEEKFTKQSWVQLMAVQAGGAICLPIFIIGHALVQNYGMRSAAISIVLGNVILMLLAFVLGLSSARHRKSTVECSVDVFGARGRHLFAWAIVFSMIGWFAIQLNIMTLSLKQLIPFESNHLCNVILGLAITALGLRGMKALELLSQLSLPLLILVIGYAVFKAGDQPAVGMGSEAVAFAGVSLILSSALGVVIDLPTFFRHSRSKRDAFLAVIAVFGILIPALEGIGVYISVHSHGRDIVEVFTGASSSPLWTVGVLLFLILAGWTTNNANLYSATVSAQVLMPKKSEAARMILLGTAGSFISCLDLLDNLEAVLDVIGIVLGGMGGVMIVHFLSKRPTVKSYNVLSWSLGMGGGIMSKAMGVSLTEIPVLDAFLISMVGSGILQHSLFQLERKYEAANKA